MGACIACSFCMVVTFFVLKVVLFTLCGLFACSTHNSDVPIKVDVTLSSFSDYVKEFVKTKAQNSNATCWNVTEDEIKNLYEQIYPPQTIEAGKKKQTLGDAIPDPYGTSLPSKKHSKKQLDPYETSTGKDSEVATKDSQKAPTETAPPGVPWVTTANMLYTLGFLITTAAMVFFLTTAWMMGGWAIVVVSIIFNVLFVYFSRLMLLKNLPIPTSIFQTLSVLTVPLTVYSIRRVLSGSEGTKKSFSLTDFKKPHPSSAFTQSVTLAFALGSMYVHPSPFLFFPISVTTVYLHRDLVSYIPILSQVFVIGVLTLTRMAFMLTFDQTIPTLRMMNFYLPFMPEAVHWMTFGCAVLIVLSAPDRFGASWQVMGAAAVMWVTQEVLAGHTIIATVFWVGVIIGCVEIMGSLQYVNALPLGGFVSLLGLVALVYVHIFSVSYYPNVSPIETILVPFHPNAISICGFLLLAFGSVMQNSLIASGIPTVLVLFALQAKYVESHEYGLFGCFILIYIFGTSKIKGNLGTYVELGIFMLMACYLSFIRKTGVSSLTCLLVGWFYLCAMTVTMEKGGDRIFLSGTTMIASAIAILADLPWMWMTVPFLLYHAMFIDVKNNNVSDYASFGFGAALYGAYVALGSNNFEPLSILNNILNSTSHHWSIALSCYFWAFMFLLFGIPLCISAIYKKLKNDNVKLLVFECGCLALGIIIRFLSPTMVIQILFVWVVGIVSSLIIQNCPPAFSSMNDRASFHSFINGVALVACALVLLGPAEIENLKSSGFSSSSKLFDYLILIMGLGQVYFFGTQCLQWFPIVSVTINVGLWYFLPLRIVRWSFGIFALIATSSPRPPTSVVFLKTVRRCTLRSFMFAVVFTVVGYLGLDTVTQEHLRTNVFPPLSADAIRYIGEFVCLYAGVINSFIAAEDFLSESPAIVLLAATVSNIVWPIIPLEIGKVALLPFCVLPARIRSPPLGSQWMIPIRFFPLVAHGFQLLSMQSDPFPIFTQVQAVAGFVSVRTLYFFATALASARVLAMFTDPLPSMAYSILWLVFDHTQLVLLLVSAVLMYQSARLFEANRTRVQSQIVSFGLLSLMTNAFLIGSSLAMVSEHTLFALALEMLAFLSSLLELFMIQDANANSFLFIHNFVQFLILAYVSVLQTFSGGWLAFVFSALWLFQIRLMIQKLVSLPKLTTGKPYPFHLILLSRLAAIAAASSLIIYAKPLNSIKLFYLGFAVTVNIEWGLLRKSEMRTSFLNIAIGLLTIPVGMLANSSLVLLASIATILLSLNHLAVVVFPGSIAFPIMLTTYGVSLVYVATEWEKWTAATPDSSNAMISYSMESHLAHLVNMDTVFNQYITGVGFQILQVLPELSQVTKQFIR